LDYRILVYYLSYRMDYAEGVGSRLLDFCMDDVDLFLGWSPVHVPVNDTVAVAGSALLGASDLSKDTR